MSQKITKLTPGQVARFGEWAKQWIEVGLSTEPADFDKATAAALRGYELANLKRPMVILRMGSPFGATLGGSLAWGLLREMKKTKKQVESQVESQVWSQVESQVGSQVWSQVWSQVGSQVESQVRSQVGSQVWSQVESQVGSQVRLQVWSQVWSQVESQVGSQVWSQVWSQVGSQVRSQVGSQVAYNSYNGAFWSSWGAYVSFLRDVAGWTDPILERFKIDEDLVRSCGWVWWHENVLAISDRPRCINRDAEGRLHCDIGPSIAYRDGWSLWHIHGVAVPQNIIENPGAITVEAIDGEKNAEVRRVMVERYHLTDEIKGAAAYIRDAGGKRLDHDEAFGTLWRRDIPDDEPIVMLEVINSTREPDGHFKHYFLRVPPTVTKAKEAAAWTFDVPVKDYAPQIET